MFYDQPGAADRGTSSLLQAIDSIRSEEQLVQRIDTDRLFRWFLGMAPAEAVFDPTAFTHNRERLREHAMVSKIFDAVLREALEAEICSDHFSMAGTLLGSYASTKSFQPKAASEKDGDSPKKPVADQATRPLRRSPSSTTRLPRLPSLPAPRLATTASSPATRGRLPRPETHKRHACEPYRPRGEAVSHR